MLETLDDPTAVIAELRRITKHGGVVGVADAHIRSAPPTPPSGLRRNQRPG
jgi:hypothetical protein